MLAFGLQDIDDLVIETDLLDGRFAIDKQDILSVAFEFVGELVDGGHLIEVKKDEETGESLYVVTSTGKIIAHELSDTIVSSIKETSYRSAIRHLSFQKRGAQLDCYSRLQENGKYMVHCEITEHGRIVLDINVEVDTKFEADKMLFNFRRRPEIVFRGTLALVSGETNYIFE